MSKPQIFISHSVTGDQDATSVLEALSTALARDGFDVLVDKQRLQLGDSWRPQLYLWMQQCHGAVILFSKGALESDWVFYEATVLTTRKFLEPEFTVLPIPLTLVKRDDLAKGRFSPMLINELHQPARTDTMEAIIDSITARFAPLKQRLTDSPVQRLERMMVPWLRQLDRDLIEEAATELGARVDTWPPDTSKCRVKLVQELLKADLFKVCQALKILAPQLDEDPAVNMLKILASSWVDECAVAPIPEVVKRPPAQRAICVNGDLPFTGFTYIQRACATFPGWPTLKVIYRPVENEYKELLHQIRTEARKILRADDDIPLERIDNWLNKEEGLDPRIVVVHGYLDEKILAELRRCYPKVTFFLLSGDDELNIEELKLKYIEFLLPKLDLDREADAYDLYLKAQWIIHACHSGAYH